MHDSTIDICVEQGLQAEQDLLALVCSGAAEHGLLLWRPSDRALVMPRRMSRLPGFAEASETLADNGWPVLLRETGGEPVPQSCATVNIALVYAQPPMDTDRPPTCGCVSRFWTCSSNWVARRHWGRWQAHSVTGVSTSISMVARWSEQPSAGARVRAARVLWCWLMERCCWMTSVCRWWRRSIVSMNSASLNNGCVPTAILPCMKRFRMPRCWSVWRKPTGVCSPTSESHALSAFRRPPSFCL